VDRPRALFFGTPAFAVPSLEALGEVADIVGVVCQPDKPQGRGLLVTAPPVKERAQQLGLEVVQPTKVRDGALRAYCVEKRADVALVVAYGRILPADVLATTRRGFVNVHASLLPRHRGAAPIAWAIWSGDAKSGVSLMVLDEGMDTGPVFATTETFIGPEETTGELSERLARLGGEAIREHLVPFVNGARTPVPQDHEAATHARMLEKHDGRMDFSRTAREVHDHVRAMNPWPGAFTSLNGKTIKVHRTRIVSVQASAAASALAGTVVFADKAHVRVACGEGVVELLTVQLEGKKAMRAVDWFVGRGVREGDRLGVEEA
jgi:methionyl-tRNA formyltransferase